MNRKYLVIQALLVVAFCGCSIRRMAVNKIGDALASGGSTYESDEDLELVGAALPFGLKLTESLLAESPRHRGLLQSACMGFTTYAYLYVQQEADRTAEKDLAAAGRLRSRARRLYLRAHRYGYRALEVASPGVGEQMSTSPQAALSRLRNKGDVPLLYWNAAALGLAISVSKHEAALLARLPEVEALVGRAIDIDESWQEGALHEFEVTLAGSRPGKPNYERIEQHYRRALELSSGKRAGLHVAYAETVPVPRQDRAAFDSTIRKALAIDPARFPEVRLQNIAAQRRASWLLERIDEFILPAAPAAEEEKP